MVGKLKLDQYNYIKKVIKQFNMVDKSPVSTPIKPGGTLLREMEAPIL